jgi:uncharacterized protein (TIGR02246 family)
MTSDDQAIRALIALWHRATAAGDVDTVLGLMTESVIFLVAGHPPMVGRSAFENNLPKLLTEYRIESTGDVQEVEVSGDLAYSWVKLTIKIVPLASGRSTVRTGNAMSILRRQPGGAWAVVRDANMLAAAE